MRYGGIETRRPLVIAAAKLCQSGMTQAAVAQALGINPCLLWEWIERYGAENFAPGRSCQHCGKSLAGMRYQSNRKFCSRTCQQKAGHARRYASRHPEGRQRQASDPALRARALELYWGGLGQTAIARHLGVATGTVDSWVHDFGGLRECQPKKEILRMRPPEERFRTAASADEWLEALRDIAPEKVLGEKTILLACGTLRGNCGVNKLVTTIMERLRRDPLDGETYAFCDMENQTITTIFWDGGMFRIGKYPKTYGSFIWPRGEFGLLLPVREAAFEAMLFYRKKRGPAGRKTLIHNNFCDIIGV
jgi:transposase-like protein